MNKIVIYGAGSYGKVFHNTITEKGLFVNYFLDEYTIEKDYNCCPIFKLRDIINQDFENIDVFISISLNNVEKIKINLLRKGYKKIYTFFESINIFPNILPNMMKTNILWMQKNQLQILQSNISKIQTFKDLLSDNKSIKLLEQVIDFRSYLNLDYYVIPDSQTQYFPTDIKFMEYIDSLRYIDCGSYIGDTIPLVMRNHNNISLVVSFEPDTKNIISLTNEINKQKNLNPDTIFLAYSCGVWNKTEILKFSADGSSASSINKKSGGVNISQWSVCYPYGAFSKKALELLSKYQCKVGFTTQVDIANLLTNNPLLLPRLDTNDLPKNSKVSENKWLLKA